MFNIDEQVIEEAWVNYSEDEKYLIRYISTEDFQKYDEKTIEKLIDFIVTDWQGIYYKKNNENIKFPCNLKNKMILFDKSPDRWSFVLARCRDYKTFFDIEKHLKN